MDDILGLIVHRWYPWSNMLLSYFFAYVIFYQTNFKNYYLKKKRL